MLFLIITIGLVFIFSCSKDKDDENPMISISSPIAFQQVIGGDVVNISGTITDNQNIKRITITLRDVINTLVLSTITKSPNKSGSTSYELDVAYPFDDLQMASGQYDFQITVTDGENTTIKYVPILFKEFEKQREGILVIGNSGNLSNIFLLENNFSSSFYTSINGDFIGASIDVYNQQLINVAKSVGNISATDLLLKNELWSVPVSGAPLSPYYTGFYYNNQTTFLGKRNGGVQGYDRYGNPNFTAGTNIGFFMESAFIHNDTYFVMEEKPIVFINSSRISLAWLYSGSNVQQATINSDVKGIYSSTENTLVFLANDVSLNAEVIFYDIPSGGKYSPFNISSLGEIDDCLEVSNGVYLVAANGDVRFVDINNYTTMMYLSGVSGDKIWFDNLENELYVADGSLLSIYDYSTRMLKGSYTHTEDIEEVLFWYNK